MIFFGTTRITTTKAKGHFHCPQCNCETRYKHKKATKFFMLYFIPIIPLGSLGEYVECQNCKTTFVPRVLDYAKSRERAPEGELV